MDPPSLEAVEAKTLTSRDIVEFHKEQAFRLGQLGFTTNFPDPSEIFKPRPTNPELSPFDEPASDEEAVKNAALSTHNSLIQLQQQGRLIAANTPLVAEASLEIDRKLLDAGKSKRYVAAQPLRQKVMDAIEIGTPSPKPNFVTVFINTPWTVKKDDMLQVNLPLKATLDEAVQLLGDIMRAENMAHQGFIGEVAGCDDVNAGWKYQLVSRNPTRVINKASVRLETEIDYREMMQQITKTEGKTPIAVLAQEPTTSGPTTDKKVCDVCKERGMEADMNEPLDDDGKPFFDPWVPDIFGDDFGQGKEYDTETPPAEGSRYNLRKTPSRTLEK